MIVLRVIGIALVLLGLVFCITIIGAPVGIPMIIIGAILVLVGKKKAPIVVNINHNQAPNQSGTPSSVSSGPPASGPTPSPSPSAPPQSYTPMATASSAHMGTASLAPSVTETLPSSTLISNKFYRADISRETPTCIVFIVDQSGSMINSIPTGKTKAGFVADVLNRTLYSLVTTCTKSDGIRNYFDIGVIGYGGNKPTPGLGGALANTILHPIAAVGENPLRIEDRTRADDDGAGGIIERRVKFPIWFEPKHDGGTPMRAALSEALQIVADWCTQHPQCYPPTVIHVTDGESTDGPPEELATSLTNIGTSDGRCLLFNIHVSTDSGDAVRFPNNESSLSNTYAKSLFKMSSELPVHLAARALERGYVLAAGARGYVYNADPKDIVNFFDIGTRPRSIAER